MQRNKDNNENFLGIPVEGIIYENHKAEQKSLEELAPLIKAVLDDPMFVTIEWAQYTPYFDDGDTCTFRVGTVSFRTTQDHVDYCKWNCPLKEEEGHECVYDDDQDEKEFNVKYGHPTLGGYEGWGADQVFKSDFPDQFHKAHALSEAIDSGSFDDVLLRAFGDHAYVKLTRDKITVDTYAHH